MVIALHATRNKCHNLEPEFSFFVNFFFFLETFFILLKFFLTEYIFIAVSLPSTTPSSHSSLLIPPFLSLMRKQAGF